MKITHIKYKTKPYTNPREVITTYRRRQLKKFITYFCISGCFGVSLFIFYICITSGNDTQKMNECLKSHDLNYCNKEVK